VCLFHLFSLGANEEFHCHAAVNERENETTDKSCTIVASQEVKAGMDTLPLESSSKQQLDKDNRQDDNGNICADKITGRKTCYDEKFPRSVDYSIILLCHLVRGCVYYVVSFVTLRLHVMQCTVCYSHEKAVFPFVHQTRAL